MVTDLPAGPEYLTAVEYAAKVNRKRVTVCAWARSGAVPARRWGNMWMIRADATPPSDGRGKYSRAAMKAAALAKARAL